MCVCVCVCIYIYIYIYQIFCIFNRICPFIPIKQYKMMLSVMQRVVLNWYFNIWEMISKNYHFQLFFTLCKCLRRMLKCCRNTDREIVSIKVVELT